MKDPPKGPKSTFGPVEPAALAHANPPQHGSRAPPHHVPDPEVCCESTSALAAITGTVSVPAAPRAGAVISEPAATVVEWNINAQAAIIGTAGQGPTVGYIHFAIVEGAVR